MTKNTMTRMLLVMMATALSVTSVFAGLNPIVKRLDIQDIEQSKTAEAIAYNFVISILDKDYNKMYSYMSSDGNMYLQYKMEKHEVTSLDELFATPGELHIHGWLSGLLQGNEVAVTYVQDEWYFEEGGDLYSQYNQIVKDGMIYLPDEDEPHVGINIKKIYVESVRSSEIGVVGFQDITRYGTVKVMMVQEDGCWKVQGFS